METGPDIRQADGIAASAKDESPLISFRGVGLSYLLWRSWRKRKRHWALRDVSFDLYRGETLGVVGRNGSGKSSLLRLLAGIVDPDEGSIHNAGASVSLLSLKLGFLGYLSGRENAVLSAMFLGMSRRDIESRMEQIIEYAELGDFFDAPVNTYSAGMKARLAFAVAFQVNPDVLLIDEVAGVGDVRFKTRSFQTMEERVRSEHSTVVFVSHSHAQIRHFCSRTLWLDQGRMMMIGDTKEVLHAYSLNLFGMDGGPSVETEAATDAAESPVRSAP